MSQSALYHGVFPGRQPKSRLQKKDLDFLKKNMHSILKQGRHQPRIRERLGWVHATSSRQLLVKRGLRTSALDFAWLAAFKPIAF